MTKRSLAGLSLAVLTGVFPATALAADRPLIWQPAKNSDTSYSVKLGMKLPTQLQPEAGLDVGLDTSKEGAVVKTPVKFWSGFTAKEIQRPAYEMNRGVGLEVDGNARSAAISMNYYEKRIATPIVDVERQSSYALRYDSRAQHWSGVDVTQSVKVSRSATGTAFVMRASGGDSFKVVGAGLGLEQKLGEHITLAGSVDRSSAASQAVASVNASYNFRW
jgi:hypothetical protein